MTCCETYEKLYMNTCRGLWHKLCCVKQVKIQHKWHWRGDVLSISCVGGCPTSHAVAGCLTAQWAFGRFKQSSPESFRYFPCDYFLRSFHSFCAYNSGFWMAARLYKYMIILFHLSMSIISFVVVVIVGGAGRNFKVFFTLGSRNWLRCPTVIVGSIIQWTKSIG